MEINLAGRKLLKWRILRWGGCADKKPVLSGDCAGEIADVDTDRVNRVVPACVLARQLHKGAVLGSCWR